MFQASEQLPPKRTPLSTNGTAVSSPRAQPEDTSQLRVVAVSFEKNPKAFKILPGRAMILYPAFRTTRGTTVPPPCHVLQQQQQEK